MNTISPIPRRVQNSIYFFMVVIFLAVFMNSYGQLQKVTSHLSPIINQQSNSTYSFNRKTKIDALMDSIKEVCKIRSMNQPNPFTNVTINQIWQNNQWINQTRESYSFDDQNNLTNIVQLWENDGWTLFQRSQSNSIENGKKYEQTMENWNGTGWIITFFSSSEYNTDNQLIFSWNYSNNETGTELLYKYITHYTYNKLGLQTTSIDSSWDVNSQKWYVFQNTFNYDTLGRQIELIEQTRSYPDDNQWNNIYKMTMVYNDQNYMNQSTHYYWDSNTPVWTPNYRNTYYHNELNNESHSIGEQWKNNTWEIQFESSSQFFQDTNSEIDISDYFDNGKLTNKTRDSSRLTHSIYLNQPVVSRINLYEQWDNGNWINDSKSVYLYNNLRGWIGSTSQKWVNGAWENVSRSFPEENPMVDSELFPEKFSLANYPNPFNSSTTILFRVPQTADVKLTIFDLMGRPIAELENGKFENGIYQSTWSGRDESGRSLSSGVYIIHLTVGNSRESKKIILTK